MKRLSIFILILFVLTLTTFVSATQGYRADGITWKAPVTGSKTSGTINLTVTNSTLNEMWNCTFYAKSSALANPLTWTTLGTATNETYSYGIWRINTTLANPWATLNDSSDYIFNATCRNTSSDITDALITGVILDNTVPTTPTSIPSSKEYTNNSASWIATVNGTTTTACVLSFRGTNPGSANYTMTYSVGSSSCTYALTTIPELAYTYYIIASDGLNSTNSADYTFTESSSSGNNPLPPVTNTDTGGILSSDVGGFPVWLIIILVIIIIIIIIIKIKK
jgi:hypothetical protein